MSTDPDDLLKRAYQILDLPAGAPLDDVKAAHATLVNGRGKRRDDWEHVKDIEWAYETLIERLRPQQEASHTDEPSSRASACVAERYSISDYVKAYIFPSEDGPVNPLYLWGRAFFFVLMVAWGLKFIFAPIKGDYIGRSFMHLINLPFHEAGHLILAFFGDFIRVLGGTLMQILIPLVCAAEFVRRGDAFGGSFGLWWTGQSFIDAAPYIYDARAGELMLLGGVTGQDAPDYHDWHNILERLGLLSYDHVIAYLAKYFGAIVLLLAVTWAACTLVRQYRTYRTSGPELPGPRL